MTSILFEENWTDSQILHNIMAKYVVAATQMPLVPIKTAFSANVKWTRHSYGQEAEVGHAFQTNW